MTIRSRPGALVGERAFHSSLPRGPLLLGGVGRPRPLLTGVCDPSFQSRAGTAPLCSHQPAHPKRGSFFRSHGRERQTGPLPPSSRLARSGLGSRWPQTHTHPDGDQVPGVSGECQASQVCRAQGEAATGIDPHVQPRWSTKLILFFCRKIGKSAYIITAHRAQSSRLKILFAFIDTHAEWDHVIVLQSAFFTFSAPRTSLDDEKRSFPLPFLRLNAIGP